MTHSKQVHQPVFVRLFELASPIVRSYHSDLGHDALWLSKAEVGQMFLWAPRECGTHLLRLDAENLITAKTMIRGTSTPVENWHVITITGNRDGHADGHVERVITSQATTDEVYAAVKGFVHQQLTSEGNKNDGS